MTFLRMKYIYVVVLFAVVASIIYLRHIYNSSKVENVTQIIHQSWKTNDIPKRFKQYSQSWTKDCFPHWKYMFWTDEDNRNIIATYYPWFLKKYLTLSSNIHRADVSRYFYLHHYGGIYTDLDNECLKPFEHLLDGYSLVFGTMKGKYGGSNFQEGYVQNSFMYSQPGHPLWIEILVEIFNSSNHWNPEVQTGPLILGRFLSQYRSRTKGKDLKIYAPEFFNPFSWLAKQESSSHCKEFDKMNDEDWTICKRFFIGKGAFVVQYHAHTWG